SYLLCVVRCCRDPPVLYSFPTRRSSDLLPLRHASTPKSMGRERAESMGVAARGPGPRSLQRVVATTGLPHRTLPRHAEGRHRRQVSWLTARTASRGLPRGDSSGRNTRILAVYSCGDSRSFRLRSLLTPTEHRLPARM